MNLQTLIQELGTAIFPSATQFVWVLLALIGLITIGMAIYNLYTIASDGPQPSGPTAGGAVARMIIGAMMVVPSVTLWRAASVFVGGGTVTHADFLTYIGGGGGSTDCENFARAIQLGFVFVGALGIFKAFRLADDAAKGFQRDGYRIAAIYFFGGLGCVFINDLMVAIGNQLGTPVGFVALCQSVFP